MLLSGYLIYSDTKKNSAHNRISLYKLLLRKETNQTILKANVKLKQTLNDTPALFSL